MHPIGFFDSGLGGISVLSQARTYLPREHFLYYGDNKNAPYGPKSLEEIRSLTHASVNFLLQKGIKALVIACNTATSASAALLRQELAIPVIGIEPALKPAHFVRHGGAIVVLATNATLRLEKFHLLMERFGDGVVPVVGEGLVELVEAGLQNSLQADALLRDLLARPLSGQVDAIVLGCTHYSFLTDALHRVAPGIPIFDGAEGTARQLRRVLEQQNLLEDGDGLTEYFSSGGDEFVRRMRKMADMPARSQE